MIAADVEELVVQYLGQSFPNVGVDMPASPPLPFYLVTGLPGSADWVTEYDTVSVHAFAATRTAASDAARQMALLMNPWVLTPQLGFTMSSGGRAFVDRFCIVEKPSWHPYENPNLERYCGRYRIELRMNQSA